jgi:F-type H+-transporting ATPase subunit epsilon
MARTFLLEVVSPEGIVWSGQAEMLITRTTEGEIGILADHEPTMAALATCSTVITAEGGDKTTLACSTVITAEGGDKTTLAIHGGFMQILHNEVTLLTDRAEIVEGGRDQAAELAQSLAGAEEPDEE